MMDVTVRVSRSAEDVARCQAVRRVVFVEGQGVDEWLEVDGRDPECVHFLAEVSGDLVGCARLRLVAGVAKAERVAVLAEHRGAGIGRVIMRRMEAEAAKMGLSALKLASQVPVVPFYEKLGYTAYGEAFVEADIEHRWMIRELT
ncbi:MAG: GNAT family N-acetyltransferase [Myxococcota bacterium]